MTPNADGDKFSTSLFRRRCASKPSIIVLVIRVLEMLFLWNTTRALLRQTSIGDDILLLRVWTRHLLWVCDPVSIICIDGSKPETRRLTKTSGLVILRETLPRVVCCQWVDDIQFSVHWQKIVRVYFMCCLNCVMCCSSDSSGFHNFFSS